MQVCRRWRYLVLESASLLGLSLLCTHGTPVKEMLAHLPPLPLILDYYDLYDCIAPGDVQDIILALRHRDRVRRIRIMQPVCILGWLIEALQGEFPNLEYLFIERHMFYMPSFECNTFVKLPETFRAPRVRYLMAMGFSIPTSSPLFTTMGNLVTLSLNFGMPCAHFHPNPLLQQLPLTPRLETSGNILNTYFPSDMESRFLRRAVTKRVTHYLRRFGVQGSNVYLKALRSRVTIRLPERLQLYFFDQQKTSFILPPRQSMNSPEPVPLKTVRITFFKDYLRVDGNSYDSKFSAYRFHMSQGGRHLDRQLASATKFVHTLGAVFSPVEHLILKYDGPPLITSVSVWHNETGLTKWRDLLGVFGNLKALYVDYVFVGQLSRFLQSEGLEGEPPTTDSDMLLPDLRDLWYSVRDTSELDDHSLFTKFTHARRSAGRPVKLFQAEIPTFIN